MNTATHTPTPWGFAQTYNGEFSVCSSRERVANHVATVPVFNGMSHSGASVPHEASVAEANAAFIVKACNAHDDLVAALRELIDDADASGVTAYFKGRGFDESIEKARAALAKAGA